MSNPATADASGREWPPSFQRGLAPAFALLAGLAVWLVLTNAARAELLGPDPGVLAERALGVVSSTVQIAAGIALLRVEDASLQDVGLDSRLLAPAVVAVGVVVLALNAAVAALVVLGGHDLVLGLAAVPEPLSTVEAAASALHYWAFVGVAEELLFRGYLQNKLVAQFGGRESPLARWSGVLAAAVAFALMHLPAIFIFGDGDLGGAIGLLVLLVLSGVTFGVVYELTRNLWLVAVLHGIGDFWPLVVDPTAVGGWPNWALIAVAYAALVVAYRQWSARSDRTTTLERITGDSGPR